MQGFIAPLLLLIALFVVFGFLYRHRSDGGTCAGCTGCADKSQCTKENKR